MREKTIIGILGSIGSGKNTVADELVKEYNFQPLSMADGLKSALSVIFGWEKELLDGITKESREWRERVDPWWASRLNMPDLTPRKMLQFWGTELVRNHFHDDTWVASMERRLVGTNSNVVISDVRFPNEIAAIRRAGGKLIKVQRGALPLWYSTAIEDVRLGNIIGPASSMSILYPTVHYSEWAWVDEIVDYDILNNGSLEDLKISLKLVMESMVKNLE